MKMLTLLTGLLLTGLSLSTGARAATIHLSDRDADQEKASAAAELLGTLTSAGFKFKSLNDGVYAVTVKNIRCELRNNGALDSADPRQGVPSLYCRANTDEAQGSTKGQRLAESQAIWERFVKLGFSDCGMGLCATFVKSVNCTVDTKVEELIGGGRFACTIEHEF